MGIIEQEDYVKIIHKKAIAVVLSCKNDGQLETAIEYVWLAKKVISGIKSNSHKETTIFNNIIRNLNVVIRLKRKMLRYG